MLKCKCVYEIIWKEGSACITVDHRDQTKIHDCTR
jgi:hypothetical protein